MTTKTAAITFARQDCTRCAGTGRHSFNGEHSRCYACEGKGRVLTAAGKAAKEAYEAACARYTIPAGSIAPGTEVWISRGPGDPAAWRRIESMEGQGLPTVRLTVGGFTFTVPATETYRPRLTEGQRAEARQAIIDLPGWSFA